MPDEVKRPAAPAATLPLGEWQRQIEDSADTIRSLLGLVPAARVVAAEICAALERGGAVFTFGNGGSALEAQHFASELISHFKRDRRALAAVALSIDQGVVTSIANDFSFADVFERQVSALVRAGDVVIGFTTSGASENVIRGLTRARQLGATAVVFTGGDGGRAAAVADRALTVGSRETARVQEGHLVLTHLVCDEIDAYFAA